MLKQETDTHGGEYPADSRNAYGEFLGESPGQGRPSSSCRV
jgi:hypothetical protein